ncbi:hypothetical protein ACTXM3_08370 [Glutamicibacter arilaitensis]|uniref:hypothetical protein n=1 Tax=Glutamicibacter arilaitensis TaxID=256701 RepID=UPI003FD5B3B8
MTSTDLKRLARAIQRDTGVNYTVALRKAKESLKAKASPAPRVVKSFGEPRDAKATTASQVAQPFGEPREAKIQRFLAATAQADDRPEPREFWSDRESFVSNSEFNEISLSYGYQRKGRYASWDVQEDHHLLCSGTTGSGKSQLLKNLALAALRDDARYEVSVIARTAGEYDWAAPYVRGLATNLDDALALVRAVHEEAVNRNEVREMFGASSFIKMDFHPIQDEGVTSRRHVLFIEELNELITQHPVPPASEDPQLTDEREQARKENRYRAEISELLTDILRVGRVSAVSIFADVHNPRQVHRDFPAFARNSAKILMGQPSAEEYALAGIDVADAPPAEVLSQKGRGVFRSVSGNVYSMQVWSTDDDSRTRLLHADVDEFDWKHLRFDLNKYRD